MAADLNAHHVQDDAVEIEEDIVAQVNVVAVIAEKRRLDADVAANRTKQFNQQMLAF